MTAASANIRALAQAMAGTTQSMDTVVSSLIQQCAQQTIALATSMAPVKTGRLRASIHVEYPNPHTAVIGPSVPYGPYQEFGTASRGEFGGSSYVIRPKYAARLAWKNKDGKWVTAKEVNHPGVKPHPYMRPAFMQALEPFTAELLRQGALQITKGPKASW